MRGPVDALKKWFRSGRTADSAHAGDAPQSVEGNPGTNGDTRKPWSLRRDKRNGNGQSHEPRWYRTWDANGVPRTLTYPSTTLGRMLDQTADRFADATAMVYHDRRWTYAELRADVNRMAGGLARLGVRRNDRVVMALPNCPEFVISFFAIQKLGAVVVNAGPLMGLDDLQKLITMTSPRVVVGLDLRAKVLVGAGAGSTIEHWIWVTLQSYQSILKRLGYQFKLWQESGAHGGEPSQIGAEHTTLAKLLADAPAKPPTLDPNPSATALMQPTSGTTGTLKLVQLSHRNLLANAMQVSTLMHAAPGQERVLAVLPMFHVYGLMLGLVSAVFEASTMILMARFSAPETVEMLRRHRPTIFPIVPAICEAISSELERATRAEGRGQRAEGDPAPDSALIPHPSSLRLCISGAAPLTQAVAERFERLTGSHVIEGYGLSETSPVTHANLAGKPRYGSIGLPLSDTRCRVVDPDDPNHDVPPGEPGELLISGPQVMSGYFASPQETSAALVTDADGATWLRTGDIVRMDEDGYFYVIDRKKDMIIRSGLKVYPAKVEKVLLRHAAVADAAVIGRPDPVHTEIVTAVIVTKDPLANREAVCDELRAMCREHLAPYEVPMRFEFVAAIPRSLLGKALKKELRAMPPIPGQFEPATEASPGTNGNGNGNGNGHAVENAKERS